MTLTNPKNSVSEYSAPSKIKIKLTGRDRAFYAVVGLILFFLLLIVLYPLIYIVSASFSSPAAVSAGKVVLWPVDLSLKGYEAVFSYGPIFIGYRNTLFYTAAGTFINVAMTLVAAYPLARKGLPGKGFFTLLFTFTMLFNGGMIPTYLLMRDLNMIDTPWVMIIPGAIGITNLIIARTFLQNSIPAELLEASQIDGCSDAKYFMSVVLPLSKAVIAVITLYYAVGHWNAYFNAFLYISDKKLYPLQLYLREILVMNQVETDITVDPELAVARQGMADLLKYSLIVVSTAPILCLYPFVQRYFIKGVMVGSLKG